MATKFFNELGLELDERISYAALEIIQAAQLLAFERKYNRVQLAHLIECMAHKSGSHARTLLRDMKIPCDPVALQMFIADVPVTQTQDLRTGAKGMPLAEAAKQVLDDAAAIRDLVGSKYSISTDLLVLALFWRRGTPVEKFVTEHSKLDYATARELANAESGNGLDKYPDKPLEAPPTPETTLQDLEKQMEPFGPFTTKSDSLLERVARAALRDRSDMMAMHLVEAFLDLTDEKPNRDGAGWWEKAHRMMHTVNRDRLRERCRTSRQPSDSPRLVLGLSVGLRDVLERAQQTARKFKDEYVGSLHLLLALVDRTHTGTSRILTECGLSCLDVLQALRSVDGCGSSRTSLPPDVQSQTISTSKKVFLDDPAPASLKVESKYDPLIKKLEQVIEILAPAKEDRPVTATNPSIPALNCLVRDYAMTPMARDVLRATWELASVGGSYKVTTTTLARALMKSPARVWDLLRGLTLEQRTEMATPEAYGEVKSDSPPFPIAEITPTATFKKVVQEAVALSVRLKQTPMHTGHLFLALFSPVNTYRHVPAAFEKKCGLTYESLYQQLVQEGQWGDLKLEPMPPEPTTSPPVVNLTVDPFGQYRQIMTQLREILVANSDLPQNMPNVLFKLVSETIRTVLEKPVSYDSGTTSVPLHDELALAVIGKVFGADVVSKVNRTEPQDDRKLVDGPRCGVCGERCDTFCRLCNHNSNPDRYLCFNCTCPNNH